MDDWRIPTQAGPGITEAGFDPLSALEKWAEDGVAPDSMLAEPRPTRMAGCCGRDRYARFPKRQRTWERAKSKMPEAIVANDDHIFLREVSSRRLPMSGAGTKRTCPVRRSMSGHRGKADLDGKRVKGL